MNWNPFRRTAALVQAAAELEAAPPTFAVDETSIDPAVFGLTSYATTVPYASRIDRKSAMQVPAVKRSYDLVAGVLGTLPVDLYASDRQLLSSDFLAQPERGIPRAVTMVRTFGDMFLEADAWWEVTERDWRGFPFKVKRWDPRKITVDEAARRGGCGVEGCSNSVSAAGRHLHDTEVIRFPSPSEPLLVTGARAIRTCLMLDDAAARAASGIPPVDWFEPADGADPAEDDDVTAILDEWQAARQARRTAYVPAALKYNVNSGFSPEQLQLADQRQHAVLEIARQAGVDPEELGVSVTSRTYANMFDRRKTFTDFTLGLYRQAFEDRMSMADVTPRGQYVKLNLSAFLRSDDLTRMQVYRAGLDVGAYVEGEPRELEDRPAVTTTPPAPVRALPTPSSQEATA